MELTLKAMRQEANMTLAEVVEKMQVLDASLPRTHVGLKHIENRGTDNVLVIAALSSIYQKKFPEVALAATGKDLSKMVQFA